MAQQHTIVGLGETLFDIVGNQSSLGGAPLNFCVMVNQLLRPLGFTTAVVSAIGDDARGAIARRHLDSAAIDTTHLQTHPTLATGVARIHKNIDAADDFSFEILPDVAWDDLRWTAELQEFTQHVSCVTYGTLAQRSAQSRETIHRFLSACPEAIRLFDVNLRLPHYDAESIKNGCANATVLKLNSHEVKIVADAADIEFGSDPIVTSRRLLEHFSLTAVVLTASDKGTTIVTPNHTYVGSVPHVVVQSSVGAGDACTAGIVAGLTLNLDFANIVGLANQLGALVASSDAPNVDIPHELFEPYLPNA